MNTTMRTGLTMLAVALLGCGVLCEQTQAAQISGDIAFFGTAFASGASAPAVSTTISFTNPWNTLSSNGDYALAGIGFNSAPATFTNFSFTGDGVSAVLSGTVTPEWAFSFGGKNYSFDLLSLTNGHTDAGSMSLSGTGTVHATGFDDTPATWSLQGSGEEFGFTLSSSTTSSIPEAGATTLLLIGFGFLAGETLRRKRKAT